MNKVLVGGAVAAAALLSVGLVARGDEERPLNVVPSVDLARYQGRWYEVARLPNSFQNKCAGEVTADYALREDGSITVVNRCRRHDGSVTEAKGVAKRAGEDKPTSMLRVRFAPGYLSFLPFVWGNYQVIALADDYSHAMVGSPDRKYLWILSREPRLDEAAYQRLAAAAREQGFDVGRLRRTRQEVN